MVNVTDPYMDWLSEVAGGTPTTVRNAGAGASRSTWLVDVTLPNGGEDTVVLRIDTGDGPLTDTEISLAREGAVYRGLQGKGVPVADFRGISDDRSAILLECVPGEAAWPGALEQPGRDQICHELAAAYAVLHAIDVSTMDVPELRPVRGPKDHALNELDIWADVVNKRARRPEPVVRFALDWLRRNAPECEEVCIVHGDAGPGNFMYTPGHLSAITDLEFAHFGDPMDDLAWLTVRGSVLGPELWPLDLIFRTYAERTRRRIDPRRVGYYQVMVITRMAIACMSARDNRKGEMNANIYFGLLPALEAQLPLLIARLAGRGELALVPPPTVPRDDISTYVFDEFLPDVARRIDDPLLAARLTSVTPLLNHLAARMVIGPAVEQECLDAVAAAIGRRFERWEDAEHELDKQFAAGAIAEDIALPLLLNLCAQQARLWPGNMRMTLPSLPTAD